MRKKASAPRPTRIGIQRADDRAGLEGKDRPVGAELVGYDNARNDPHAEGHRKDLEPVSVEIGVERLAGFEPQRFENEQ